MGKKKKILKAVLDTNVVVSALLFKGEVSKLHALWKEGVFTPVISAAIFHELQTVLEYPKFRLTKKEIGFLLEEEIIPFFHVQDIFDHVNGVCRDNDDDKFLSCAASASADYLVTGDDDLRSIAQYGNVLIIKPADFLKIL